MRFDLFIRKQSEWICYVQAVTKANALRIIVALESQGEHVGAFYHARTLGKMAYQTSEGWNFTRGRQAANR